MMHLIKTVTLGGAKGVDTACGTSVPKEQATIWWRDVDCPKCRPYDWEADPQGLGKRMVRVDAESTPKVKVWKRRAQRST